MAGHGDDDWTNFETEPADGIPQLRVRRFHLDVTDGQDKGQVFASSGPTTVIGTHESADFRLTDPTVSRFHCEIHVSGGSATLVDLESRNGTRVGGLALMRARLMDDLTLELGRTTIHFRLGIDHVDVPISGEERFGTLVGRSPAMRAAFARLERAAATDLPLLIEGETGTGKDVAAHAVHQKSKRANGPFVVVDCGALPPALLESELFGHERGAFTGAHDWRVGAFEAASSGTLFLDEIGELSRDLQPKLLRVLESRRFRRVGGSKEVSVDIRVIAATNRDLRSAVNEGGFRSDLFYRFAVLEVTLPPLRERPQDLESILAALLEEIGADAEATARLSTGEFVAQLQQHTWPGNVRELRNYVERCVTLGSPVSMEPDDTGRPPAIDASEKLRPARKKWIAYFERAYLRELLDRHQDNVTAAARAAGLTRAHLHKLLSRSGLR